MYLKINKHAVQQCFARQAHQYDAHAGLQREVARQLCSLLPEIRSPSGWWLDVGAGSGFSTRQLAMALPAAQTLGVDCTVPLLQVAASHQEESGLVAATRCLTRPGYIAGDFDRLPFVDGCFAGVLSSLALQWSPCLAVTLQELRRMLKRRGALVLATLLEGSLAELQQARGWPASTQPRFYSANTLQNLLIEQGFVVRHWHTEVQTLVFTSLETVLKSLKGIGANAEPRTDDQSRGLCGRGYWQRLAKQYPKRSGSHWPLTYQIAYVYCCLS